MELYRAIFHFLMALKLLEYQAIATACGLYFLCNHIQMSCNVLFAARGGGEEVVLSLTVLLLTALSRMTVSKQHHTFKDYSDSQATLPMGKSPYQAEVDSKINQNLRREYIIVLGADGANREREGGGGCISGP